MPAGWAPNPGIRDAPGGNQVTHGVRPTTVPRYRYRWVPERARSVHVSRPYRGPSRPPAAGLGRHRRRPRRAGLPRRIGGAGGRRGPGAPTLDLSSPPVPVVRATVTNTVSVTGTVVADPAVPVKATAAGTVRRLLVAQGTTVTAGQALL